MQKEEDDKAIFNIRYDLYLPVLEKYIVEDIALEEGYSSIKFGPGMIIYILHLIIFFLLFVYIFVKKYKKFTGIEKVRLQYLLLGVVFSMIGVSITNLILPVFFDVFYLSDYGPAFLLIFVGFVFFSIVKLFLETTIPFSNDFFIVI